MRVALIIERFESGGGGLESAAWQTAHTLADAGDEVTVVARRCEPSRAIETVELSVPSAWQPLRVRAFARRARVWIAQARREKRVDCTHAWSRVPGAHLFHTGEGSHRDYMLRSYTARGERLRRISPRHTALLRLEQQVLSTPGLHLQHVSGLVARELSARFEIAQSHQHQVGYGVDLERFAATEDIPPEALRSQIDPGARRDTPCFLLAGSGWRRKGLDTALRALAEMRGRDARLWVAGNDRVRPWQQLAERLGVAERVVFLGPRGDLERVYTACDALFLPTRYDAFGMVCLEAAAAGRPCLLSATAGAAELFAESALIVSNPEDHRGFAKALDSLCDPQTRASLAQRGHAVATAHSWQHQTERLRVLYRQLADGS